ncbi:alpha/beta hydrolase family protein [Undibacterium sp. Di27W]|uniref:alpha/beta hydrolase family protein n=1 Tax=Undibacterium sp. Di27W TaxID=3413036 RepID=UPI003BF220B8
MKSRFYCALLTVLFLTNSAISQAATELPVEAFAALPAVQNLSLSPDGKKVAMLVNQQGTSSIVVNTLGQAWDQSKPLLSTDNKKFNFKWVHWVSNDKLLVSTLFPERRIVNGYTGGVDVLETRLLAVSIDGKSVVNLVKPNSVRGPYLPQFQDRVIDFSPDDGKHVLIMLADQERSIDPGVYSLDLETASRSLVQSARQHFHSWMTDRQHRVRLGIYQDKTDIEIHVCDPDGRNWRKRWSYQALSAEAVTPLGFGKNPNQLYILSNHQGRQALFTVDLGLAEAKPELVLANAQLDMNGQLVYSNKTGEAIGLLGTSFEGKAEINYWEQNRRELAKFIDDAIPNRINQLVSMSADENRYVVHSSNHQTPGQFYLGDDAANTLELFAQNYPALPAASMVSKKMVTIKSHDGLKLPAYLSLPQVAVARNLPTVLLVHGGPQGHDDASFDIWTQFLANRGYAVLQVNFRGSTGYGSKLMASGLKRWGQEMQDDLSDATRWMIAQGTADPARICIVGASYGGYAALMGVAKTPELYQCAVSFAGVSDLFEMGLDKSQYQNGKALFEKQVGSLDEEKARLKSTSPRFLAKTIKAPVLLVHGMQDRSVSVEQSVMMDAALTEAGTPHRFIRLENGDHYLSMYEHRMLFFKELEAFLAKSLKTAK